MITYFQKIVNGVFGLFSILFEDSLCGKIPMHAVQKVLCNLTDGFGKISHFVVFARGKTLIKRKARKTETRKPSNHAGLLGCAK